MDENSYPVYRRRNNGQTFLKNRFVYDNRHVVPYNPYLSARYNAHINVEIATSITSVKYLYKYVYKGSDRAVVALEQDGGRAECARDETEGARDEIKTYLDARYVSASEGKTVVFDLSAYRFSNFLYFSSMLEDFPVFHACQQSFCHPSPLSPS